MKVHEVRCERCGATAPLERTMNATGSQYQAPRDWAELKTLTKTCDLCPRCTRSAVEPLPKEGPSPESQRAGQAT